MAPRALVVEDDPSLREVATMVLERAGFAVESSGDGREAIDRARAEPFDLVLLDLMLPTIDGFAVCREIRRTSQVPIVMLTARTATADVVTGLGLGADDYVTKPFEAQELVARVRAVMRRATATTTPEQHLVAGPLLVDPAAMRATLDGVELTLTATEFRLLCELMRNRGVALSREDLLKRVWGYDFLGDSRIVDVAVWRLRDKLGDEPRAPRYIITVRGLGYRFDGPDV